MYSLIFFDPLCLRYRLERQKEKRRHKERKKSLEEKRKEKREEKRKKQEKKRKNQEEEEELQGKRKHARSMNCSEFVQGATTEGLQVIFLARFLY